MNYNYIKKSIQNLKIHIAKCREKPKCGIGSFPESELIELYFMREEDIFSHEIINIMKENCDLFDNIIDYIQIKFKKLCESGKKFEECIEEINNCVIKNSDKELKKQFIKFNKIIIEWLKKTDFFTDILENTNTTIITNDQIVQNNNMSTFKEFRINQTDAFERLKKNGLETGIHCQATGCGKSYIILYYIDYMRKKMPNPKIILFTERINILSDLFEWNKKENTLEKHKAKINKWKNMGICDLTDFEIINRVTEKKKDWGNKLIQSKQPTLLVINRAFLTLGKQFDKIQKNDVDLIIHDECHNTTSFQCHDFLKHCKSKEIPIVGFSATPLRTGKNDLSGLLEIYSQPDNKKKLNLLTNYSMIYAITKNLVLPPEFHWFEIGAYKTHNDKNETQQKNILITKPEIGSALGVLNNVALSLPNKKIVAWCGTIKMAKMWKEIFEKHKQYYKYLETMISGIDTSETITNDYELFKVSKGNSILFCANKHREGSDIVLLDCCIFLDKVKDRGSIPFIQSIGRVLRLCPDTINKTKGVIIDSFVKENNETYEKDFVHKIIGYYMSLQNLSDITDIVEGESKLEKYFKLKDIVVFNKDKETIEMNLGNKSISIHCNKLEWNKIIDAFGDILETKLKCSEDDKLNIEFDKTKKMVKECNITNETMYNEIIVPMNNINNPREHFKNLWKGWNDFLNIDTSIYPKTLEEWKKQCIKRNITKHQKYKSQWSKYKLPEFPEELYGFKNFYSVFCDQFEI